MRLFGKKSTFKKPSRPAPQKPVGAVPSSAASEPKSSPVKGPTRPLQAEQTRSEPAQKAARKEAARRPARPLLDPHGIYGTRTAGRLRAAQRRRTMQTLLLFAMLIGLGFGLVSWARTARVLRVSSLWTHALMAVPSSAPVLVSLSTKKGDSDPAHTLLAPTEEGLLLAVDASNGTVKTGFTTAFPLRAQPLAVADTVFIGGSDGVFSAVRWRTGQVLWTRRTSAAFSTRPAFARILLPSRQTTHALQPAPALPSGASPSASASRIAPTNIGASGVTVPISHSTSAAGTSAAGTSAAGTSAAGTSAAGTSAGDLKLRGVIFAGNDAGEITAMEASSGRLLWRYHAKAPVGSGLTATQASQVLQGFSGARRPHMSTPASRILVPLLGGVGSSGGILCLDARTGRALWRKDLGAACLPAPVVEENAGEEAAVEADKSSRAKPGASKRLLSSGISGRVYCCTDNGAVLCLELSTGRKIWKVFVEPLSAARLSASSAPQKPDASNDNYRPNGSGEAQSDDGQNGAASGTASGAEEDARDSAIALRGEPLLHAYDWGKCLVLGGNDGGVRCLNARNGALLWSFDARFAVRCRPSALRVKADGQAQMDDASNDLQAAPSGQERDLILLGSDGPVVYALDARDGTLAWQFATRGAVLHTPFLSNQEMVALTGDGYVQSFALPQ